MANIFLRRARRRFLTVLLACFTGLLMYLAIENKTNLFPSTEFTRRITPYATRSFSSPFYIEKVPAGSFLSTPKNSHNERLINNMTTTEEENLSCAFPELDPWDKSIGEFVHKLQPLKCKYKPALTYIDDGILVLNETARDLEYKNAYNYCYYWEFDRQEGHDNGHNLFTETKIFTKNVIVEEDFVQVKCFRKSDIKNAVYSNIHAHVSNYGHGEANKKVKKWTNYKKPLSEKVSVLLFFIDGLSRLNAIRQLPKTYKLFTETLKGIVMKGYHSVGVSTFPNLVPVTTGKTRDELPNVYKDPKQFLDIYPIIWKNFSDNDYVTFYSEDKTFSTFNYLKKGFNKKPTDYYARPFFLEMERQEYETYHESVKYCYRDQPIFKIVADYLQEFLVKYSKIPYFAFHFLNDLSHDYLNPIQLADDFYFRYFSNLYSNGHLDNTVVLFLSDHGNRYDAIRTTAIGRMEERLPLMIMTIPKQFRENYSHIINILEKNSNRLVTPFDLHATLLDILKLNMKFRIYEKDKRGLSLFGEMPLLRTCDTAGVPDAFCVCRQQAPVAVNTSDVVQASLVAVKTINDILARYNYSSTCHILHVSRIFAAYKSENMRKQITPAYYKFDKQEKIFFQDYLIVYETEPGNARFEQIIRLYPNKPSWNKTVGPISRINKYGNTSWCVTTFYILRNYCYCKHQRDNWWYD